MYLISVTENETGITFQVNTTQTSIIFIALHPDYTYLCIVAAVTIAPGPYSNTVVVITDPGGKLSSKLMQFYLLLCVYVSSVLVCVRTRERVHYC